MDTVEHMRRERAAGKLMEDYRREWKSTPPGIDKELARLDYVEARDAFLHIIRELWT